MQKNTGRAVQKFLNYPPGHPDDKSNEVSLEHVGQRGDHGSGRDEWRPGPVLGRPMKVSREEIVGLVTALGMFVQQDEAAEMAHYPALAQRESMRWSRRPAC